MGDAETADIAEFDPFQMAPQPLAGIQFRGIGREPFEVEAVSCPIGQERFDEVTAMNRRPIPEDQQTGGHLAQQVLQESDDISGINGLVLAMKIQLAFRRDGANGREVIPRPPFPENGRLSYRGIGAGDTGQGVEPGFINEEDRLPLGLRPLLSAGHVSSRQRVMAASSRWRARRAGFCGLQRMASHKRPTWRG
jgi:hypothetical protein